MILETGDLSLEKAGTLSGLWKWESGCWMWMLECRMLAVLQVERVELPFRVGGKSLRKDLSEKKVKLTHQFSDVFDYFERGFESQV